MALAEQPPRAVRGPGGRGGADLHHRRWAAAAPGAEPLHPRRGSVSEVGTAARSPRSRRAPELVDSARRRGSDLGFLRHRPVRVRRRTCRRPTSSSSTRCSPARRSRWSRSSSRTSTHSTSSRCCTPSSRCRPGSSCGTEDLLTSIGHSRKLAVAHPRLAPGRVPRRRAHGDPRARGPGQRRARGPARGGGPAAGRIVSEQLLAAPGTRSPASGVGPGRTPPTPLPCTRSSRPASGRARPWTRRRRPPRRPSPRWPTPWPGTAACWRARGTGRSVRCCSSPPATVLRAAPGRGAARTPRATGWRGRWSAAAEEVAAPARVPTGYGVARAELPATIRFWEHLGYVEVDREGACA